jgi:phosphopantetheinyl transferase (holo-ACP synthase)
MARATRLGISAWSVSLSHTSEQAIAVVAGVG